MVRDRENYDQALRLRERGFTLQEIARVCGVSKSTVSKWLKNNVISADITKKNKKRAGQENAKRLQLMQKARGTERVARYSESLKNAVTEFKHYKTSTLFMSGLMLYSAHGDRQDESKVRFSTTDIQAHKIFIKFTKEYLGVDADDIRLWLQLYQDQAESVCMKKWQRATALPYQQFYRTQFVQTSSKNTLHYGVGNTIISRTVLQRKLLKWVDLAQKELVK